MKAEIVGLNDRLRESKYYMKFLDGVTKEFMRKDEEDRFRTERVSAVQILLGIPDAQSSKNLV
jgi:hypothetical protein